MRICLGSRTSETVAVYFERAQQPHIRRMLPQRAATVEEALADFERTQLPGANSFGQTIYVDGRYAGDVWCYCIDLGETPNAMLSYCIFESELYGRGVATEAVKLFLEEIRERFGLYSIGAFTYEENKASIRVLEKNGFSLADTFVEDGVPSCYYQRDLS